MLQIISEIIITAILLPWWLPTTKWTKYATQKMPLEARKMWTSNNSRPQKQTYQATRTTWSKPIPRRSSTPRKHCGHFCYYVIRYAGTPRFLSNIHTLYHLADSDVLSLLQTGPTSSMVSNYVTAAILSAANLLGHQAGSSKPCSRRGTNISCLVKFGGGEIDYNSYAQVQWFYVTERAVTDY